MLIFITVCTKSANSPSLSFPAKDSCRKNPPLWQSCCEWASIPIMFSSSPHLRLHPNPITPPSSTCPLSSLLLLWKTLGIAINLTSLFLVLFLSEWCLLVVFFLQVIIQLKSPLFFFYVDLHSIFVSYSAILCMMLKY